MRGFLFFLLITLFIQTSGQNIFGRYTKLCPPPELGYTPEDVSGDNLADSLARLELKGYVFPLQFMAGLKGKRLEESGLIWVNEKDVSTVINDTLIIGFTARYDVAEWFPGELRYQWKGLKIEKYFGFELDELDIDTPIFEQQTQFSSPSDSVSIKIPLAEILKAGEDGRFYVSFDSIFRVDSKGREFLLPEDCQRNFGVEISIFRDLIGREFGAPRPIFLVNGEIHHEGDFVPKDAEVFLSLIPSPSFVRKYPHEQTYQMRGVRIREHGCFGGNLSYETDSVSEWSEAPRIQIPIDSLERGYSGDFYVQIGEIWRKGADGRVFKQEAPGRFYVYFRMK